MQTWLSKHRRRRGSVAPLTALLMIPTLAMVAFAVDVGWLVVTQSDLQNAADSAALAGADRLMEGYVHYHLPGQSQRNKILEDAQREARETARQYARHNAAGGVRSLVLHDSDIEFGFTDEWGNHTPEPQYTGFPNTIKVTLRRDPQANGAVVLGFAPLLGSKHASVRTSAAATIYTGVITDFRDDRAANGSLIPIAFDVDQWAAFYDTGTSPGGTADSGPNGGQQIKVYPSPKSTPGNFGLVNIGQPNNGTPGYRQWIQQGSSPGDIRYLRSNRQLPVGGGRLNQRGGPPGMSSDISFDSFSAATANSSNTWPASPGLRSTLVRDLASQIGQPRLLPLFEPVAVSPYRGASGNGSNARYRIVGFVGVQITQATGSGSNLNISVQPAAVLDPNALYSSVAPAGTSSHYLTTFVPPKLTQ